MALYSTFRVAEAMDEAFERIQFDPKGIVAEHIMSARRSIRLLLSEWNNDSVTFWKVVQYNHTVALNEEDFTPPAGVLDVLNAAVLRSDILTPLTMLAREDWFAIPDRGQNPGMPNRFWVQRTAVPPRVWLYPQAENATDVIQYDAWVQFNDSSQLSGSPDIPPRWEEAFVAGLTAKLAEKYKPELHAAKLALAGGPMIMGGKYAVARAGDRERGDTVMVLRKSRRARR